MDRPAYINQIASFLPNMPIENEEIEATLQESVPSSLDSNKGRFSL